jgi:hypothetical protein
MYSLVSGSFGIRPRAGAVALMTASMAAALALAGCATPYQKMGMNGGVRAVQLQTDLAQVTARGSPVTDADTIERYVLRKAAETTLQAGYDHFEIVSSSDRTRTFQGFAGYMRAVGEGLPTAGVTVPFIRPGETVLIRMQTGAAAPTGAVVFDARDLLAHLAPPPRAS